MIIPMGSTDLLVVKKQINSTLINIFVGVFLFLLGLFLSSLRLGPGAVFLLLIGFFWTIMMIFSWFILKKDLRHGNKEEILGVLQKKQMLKIRWATIYFFVIEGKKIMIPNLTLFDSFNEKENIIFERSLYAHVLLNIKHI